MIDLITPYEKLSRAEAKRLQSLMRERHGNVKACKELTGVAVNTLKRAAGGMEITKDNAKAIREKLLSSQLQAA